MKGPKVNGDFERVRKQCIPSLRVAPGLLFGGKSGLLSGGIRTRAAGTRPASTAAPRAVAVFASSFRIRRGKSVGSIQPCEPNLA
jgi:hypothetical protein